LVGEGGGDWLVDGQLDEASKDDILSGGDGDDILFGDHVPAVRDIVTCGGGFDRAVVDRKDVVADDCEQVRLVRGSFEEVLEQEDAFIASLPPEVGRFFSTFFEEQLAPFPATSRAATSPATR
jgi:hypothetical protein